jgi:hypothetical protein
VELPVPLELAKLAALDAINGLPAPDEPVVPLALDETNAGEACVEMIRLLSACSVLSVLCAASTELRPTLLLPRASAALNPPPTVTCVFDACGAVAVAETLSLGRDEPESTDPDEKSVLLAAVPLGATATVSPSLASLPFCSVELEWTAGVPVPCPAKAITDELEPLIHTIPDPMLSPLAAIPDAEVPETAAG